MAGLPKDEWDLLYARLFIYEACADKDDDNAIYEYRKMGDDPRDRDFLQYDYFGLCRDESG